MLGYFGDEERFDYEVYDELAFSHRHYYRLKSSAFYKLAFAMKVVVYMEVESA
ncbi:hypothetical protein MKX79_14990 [Viridibacillus sp. FSL R5-0468]|uniref:hypothetical protein n=1 Tax=Viridibacillus sp. FSL R5-0468 TaxID=2921640 RepID=UPI0030F5ECA4